MPFKCVFFQIFGSISSRGCRPLLRDGLLKTFVLPNGHRAHFYFSGKAVCDPVDAELSSPPTRPASEGDVREQLPVVGSVGASLNDSFDPWLCVAWRRLVSNSC